MAVYINRSQAIAERLVKLRDYLYVNATPNHAVKAAEILAYLASERHEVEIKTLYRDIETLRNFFGLDIDYDGRQKGYLLKNPKFEPHELRMMVNSIQAAKFITQQEADRLTEKIMGELADVYTRPSLKRRTFIKNRVRATNEKMIQGLDTIYEAIAKDRKISYKNFRYFVDNMKKGKYYRIDDENSPIITASPYNVIWDGEHFLIHVAFTEGEMTIIEEEPLDNMEDIKILNSSRENTDLFQDIIKYEANTPKNLIFPSQFKIKVANLLATRVVNKFGNNVRITPLDDNFFIAAVDSTLTPELFLWVLEFGPDAEIIFPEDAQARLTYYILELLKGNPPFRDENI